MLRDWILFIAHLLWITATDLFASDYLRDKSEEQGTGLKQEPLPLDISGQLQMCIKCLINVRYVYA